MTGNHDLRFAVLLSKTQHLLAGIATAVDVQNLGRWLAAVPNDPAARFQHEDETG